jgi:hypothetical protein
LDLFLTLLQPKKPKQATMKVGFGLFLVATLWSARAFTVVGHRHHGRKTVGGSSILTATTMDTKDTVAGDAASPPSLALLDQALDSNMTAASLLLDQIAGLRNRSAVTNQPSPLQLFIDDLLQSVNHCSWWSRIRPLARVSRRARRASLRRLLKLSVPKVEEEDTAEASLRRQRQAFISILLSLNETQDDTNNKLPKIVSLERAARRQPVDMAQRLPSGLETPNYTVLKSAGLYEVRHYEPFSVCSVSKANRTVNANTDAPVSNPQLSGARSFGALAGYLFGKNADSVSMKMTTPVLSNESIMSFVLPSTYWSTDSTAPQPLPDSGVFLSTNPGGDFAVVMFGGFAGKQEIAKRSRELLSKVRNDPEWELLSDEITVAQYNDPFTPPWKRRNEVAVEVQPKAK